MYRNYECALKSLKKKEIIKLKRGQFIIAKTPQNAQLLFLRINILNAISPFLMQKLLLLLP